MSSEFLIAQWEAKATELERQAAIYRDTMMGLTAQTLERARAFRSCIADLKRFDQPTADTEKGEE